MANPYSRPSLTGYNQNAPADDGSEVESNRVEWQKHLDKIGGPLRTFAEAVDERVFNAFAKRFGNAVRTDNTDATFTGDDDGKLASVTGATTITLPDAAVVSTNWTVMVINSDASETVTVDGSGSQTINGSATISILPGKFAILISDASNFFALHGQAPGSATTAVLADGALSADDDGRGKMAANYFSADDAGREKFADDFFGAAEAGSGIDPLLKFETDFFSADSDGRRPFQSEFVNTDLIESSERMTTANVLTATSGLTAGAVGSYALLTLNSSQNETDFGANESGSNLNPSACDGSNNNTAQSGSWQCVGFGVGNVDPPETAETTTLWLRIS